MLALEMDLDDFSASNGWLQAWQKRHSVKWAALCSEAADVPEDVVPDWAIRLPDLLSGYAPANVFNADETGLYYRALPNRSMVVRSDPRKGIKTAKERVTVLLACSAAGEKLTPLLIGKSAKPRCFKGLELVMLPVTYRANKKAWMTSLLFKEWVERLNRQMQLQERNILLFVDNCAAHPDVQVSNVKIVFLPPNTTSRLQPCDAGIIAALKAHYRRRLMRHVLAEMDEARTATELSKRVDILDAIRWVHLAWTSVGDTAIVKCFAKCGFQTPEAATGPVAADTVDVAQPDGAAYAELLGDVPWQTYVAMDDATSTADVTGDDWEAALIARAKGLKTADQESEEKEVDEEEEAEVEEVVITTRQAVSSVRDLLTFATRRGDVAMMDIVTKLQGVVEDCAISQASAAKQTPIGDFFARK